MNDIVSFNHVFRHFLEEIPCAETDVRREPSFGWTLAETNIEAVELCCGRSLLRKIKKPHTGYENINILKLGNKDLVVPRASGYIGNLCVVGKRWDTRVEMEAEGILPEIILIVQSAE